MKEKFVYTYTVIVLVISIIYLLIAVPSAVWGVIRVSVPEFTMNEHQYRMHVNNHFYCQANTQYCQPMSPGKQEPLETPPSNQEVTQQRIASKQVALQSERRLGLQDVVNWGLGGVFAAILFYAHRKKLNQVKPQTPHKT